MANEWVLVTGASSGIGLELAKIFAEHGYPLVLTSRNEARLKGLAGELTQNHGVQVKTITKDLAVASAPFELQAELERDSVPISILVNNAGFGLAGSFTEKPLQTYTDMIQVNVMALVQLTHLLVRPMIARHNGKILNVASTAAFQPGPLMAVYYASKAFVFSFSYALTEELAGTGVTVTTLCPGPTHTRFFDRAETTRSERIVGKWMMGAREVAELGFRGLMQGKRVVIPGFMNKMGAVLAKRVPTVVAAKGAKKVNSGG